MTTAQKINPATVANLVTVIIPAFNSAKLINECLESVVCQDYLYIEVIVVDGASTDNTIEVVESVAHRHLFVHYISEPDQGVYDAINKGIQLARGEWIYVLGSDDRLASTGALSAMSTSFGTESDFIHAKVLRMSTGMIEGAPTTSSDIVLANICQQSILYRKTLFDILGNFNLKYKICADWEFNIRCFGIPCKPTFVDIVLCCYDGRGMSSHITDHVFYNDRLSIARRSYHVPLKNSVFRPLRYLFRDEGKKYWKERKFFHSLVNQIIFLMHAVIARFERLVR